MYPRHDSLTPNSRFWEPSDACIVPFPLRFSIRAFTSARKGTGKRAGRRVTRKQTHDAATFQLYRRSPVVVD